MSAETYYAPARRADAATVHRQQASVASVDALSRVASLIPEFVMVLNEERQVVYANDTLVRSLGMGSALSVCGARPGELLHCVHADETASGCGTSSSCRLCGAIQAILETQRTNSPAAGECTTVRMEASGKRTYNFRVATTPFEIEEQRFVLFSLQDIGESKRKGALERIFFHDIMNTASSLKVYIDLIKRSRGREDASGYAENLETIADSLIEEIQSQKMLVYAENGTLEVQKNLISSREIAERIIDLFLHDELARDKSLEIAPFSESLSFISDEAILRRVLVNAVKNALEAAETGSQVVLGYGGRGGEVWFSVRNQGVIEEQVRANLFKRYYSTKGSNRGLGTYSMKLLTEEYLGGEVRVDSSEERGTIFTFVIPDRGAVGTARGG